MTSYTSYDVIHTKLLTQHATHVIPWMPVISQTYLRDWLNVIINPTFGHVVHMVSWSPVT